MPEKEEEHQHWDEKFHADCPQCVAQRKARHPSSFRDDIEKK